ncbi:MAG: polysaccharide biosynthesis C-terminal domain-containing protein, partial [Acidobacteriota bacterium]
RILLVAFPLLSLNYGLTTQLIGWNGQRAFALISTGALVANIAMNAYLIPHMAAAGAAWATVATEALITLACVYALRRAPGRAAR